MVICIDRSTYGISFEAMRSITNIYAAEYIIEFVMSSVATCTAGLFMYFYLDISAMDNKILSQVLLFVFVLVFFLLPSYFLICCLRTYICERRVCFTIDEQNDSIRFQKGDITLLFGLSDIDEWYCYECKVSYDVYELHLKSGEVVRFSGMIPLYEKYLLQQSKLHKLPPLQMRTSWLKLYVRSAIEYA